MKFVYLIVLLALTASTVLSEDEIRGVSHRLGVSAGLPQLCGITWEITPHRYLSVDVHVGSVFFASLIGVRAVAGDTSPGLRPRCFLGWTLFKTNYAEYADSAKGTTGYLWTGASLAWAFSDFRVYGEIGYLGGGDKNKGLGYSAGVVFAGGVLFDL